LTYVSESAKRFIPWSGIQRNNNMAPKKDVRAEGTHRMSTRSRTAAQRGANNEQSADQRRNAPTDTSSQTVEGAGGGQTVHLNVQAPKRLISASPTFDEQRERVFSDQELSTVILSPLSRI
jgi:hypothetical protein